MFKKHLPIISLIVSFIITLAVTYVINNLISETINERFSAQVSETTTQIKTRLQAYEQVLLGERALFVGRSNVTSQEWTEFVKSQNINQQYPGIQGSGYFKHVIGYENLTSLARQIRSEGFPSFSIHPDVQKNEYYPVIFIEPLDARNQKALGFDVFSESKRRATIEYSRDTGNIAITPKIILVQEGNDKNKQSGFLMICPVYGNLEPHSTVEDRRNNIVGFVYGAFRMNDLMNNILDETQKDISFSIYDTQQNPENIMYNHTAVNNIKVSDLDLNLLKSTTVDIDGRAWTLTFVGLKSIHTDLEYIVPILVLIAGISLSILLYFVFRTYDKVVRLTEELIRKEKLSTIGELSSRLSHDLRNTLSVIKHTIMLMKANEQNMDDRRSRLYDGLERAINQINMQIIHTLDFVRHTTLKLAEHSLSSILKNSMENMVIPDTVQIKLPENDAKIICDGVQISVVFSNIILNAIQAMDNNGVINIRINDEADKTVIEFEDTGPGIPKDMLTKIFTPLFTTKSKGTGLGLVTCKNIIEQHGGAISVNQKPAIFMISFIKTKLNI